MLRIGQIIDENLCDLPEAIISPYKLRYRSDQIEVNKEKKPEIGEYVELELEARPYYREKLTIVDIIIDNDKRKIVLWDKYEKQFTSIPGEYWKNHSEYIPENFSWKIILPMNFKMIKYNNFKLLKKYNLG